ncbi:MAG: alpha-glucan family phosphorylase [Gemmatimonadales bacterium]
MSSTPVDVPERLRPLLDLSRNLWWSWQPDARELFRRIDRRLWEGTRHNPVEFLRQVPLERLQRQVADPQFLAQFDAVVGRFARLAHGDTTWFAQRHPDVVSTGRPIAYFSAEFALHRSIPVYSGGLGVLAGDLCKEASDLGVPLVGIGLFYHKGYFDQRVGVDGWQRDSDDPVDTGASPLTRITTPQGDPTLVRIRTSGRDVHIGAWRVMVGRVPIYLLDTDLEANDPADRDLAARLYTVATELRLRQEWVLGVGGVRLLRALGIEPAVWHANEGHAAFLFVERVRELTAAGVPVSEAERRVRATSVFTTHTPVPAGHDSFTMAEIEHVAGPFWEGMGITRQHFAGLGGFHPGDERYHMTLLALRLAGRVNGVSARHGEESRRIWREIWPDRSAAEVPIGHVTNGVHLGTWMGRAMRELLAQVVPDWEARADDPAVWRAALTLDDQQLWAAHEGLRQLLHNYIREEARHRWRDHWKDPAKLAGAGALLSPNVLTIGFARRFATYKRADLLLRDLDRLRRLVTNSRRPVQIIFAGKAHPADDPGKHVLQQVYTAAQDPSFEGRIAFLEDYDLHLAQRLVQGVDVWLNLPRPPLEACGTSGMKAALNGVPQISTLDGWWAEGYTGDNGWVLPPPPPDADVDAWDLEHVFRLLEDDVVPRFYRRPQWNRVSADWARVMKHAIAVAGERFTTRRMLQQYVADYYLPAARGEPAPGDLAAAPA